jgi:hypothetical protein
LLIIPAGQNRVHQALSIPQSDSRFIGLLRTGRGYYQPWLAQYRAWRVRKRGPSAKNREKTG